MTYPPIGPESMSEAQSHWLRVTTQAAFHSSAVVAWDKCRQERLLWEEVLHDAAAGADHLMAAVEAALDATTDALHVSSALLPRRPPLIDSEVVRATPTDNQFVLPLLCLLRAIPYCLTYRAPPHELAAGAESPTMGPTPGQIRMIADRVLLAFKSDDGAAPNKSHLRKVRIVAGWMTMAGIRLFVSGGDNPLLTGALRLWANCMSRHSAPKSEELSTEIAVRLLRRHGNTGYALSMTHWALNDPEAMGELGGEGGADFRERLTRMQPMLAIGARMGGTYNEACLAALRGDDAGAEAYLAQAGTLGSSRSDPDPTSFGLLAAINDPDFESLRSRKTSGWCNYEEWAVRQWQRVAALQIKSRERREQHEQSLPMGRAGAAQ